MEHILSTENFKVIAENLVLFGGAVMALYYGIKRLYNTARNVEKLVETSEKNVITAKDTADHLFKHIRDEDERDTKRDQKMEQLAGNLNTLGAELRAHVKMEEDRDLIRDQQLITLSDHMEEVVNEMRPNGGSSMKDILTSSSKKVDEVHTRLSVVEQWKTDHMRDIEPLVRLAATIRKPKSKPKRIVRRSGRP